MPISPWLSMDSSRTDGANQLATVWAKSRRPGQSRGESLAEHTAKTVKRLEELAAALPGLAGVLGEPLIWRWAFWACVLHDLGKAAEGFQASLREGASPWGHRHEVASLAFVDWLLPDQSKEVRTWVAAAVASHHRDHDELARLYPAPAWGADEAESDASLDNALAELSDGAVAATAHLLSGYVPRLARQSRLPGLECAPRLPEDPVRWFRTRARQAVRNHLDAYSRLVRALRGEPSSSRSNLTALALRGLVVLADHSASAGIRLPAAPLGSPDQVASSLFTTGSKALYAHQRQAASCAGNAVLVAPTGSGKTEAALVWASAAGESVGGRVFYILPYQASLNAMHDRLQALFPGDVGLQHGRSAQALYRRLIEQGEEPAHASATARRQRALARLHHFPIRVLTPYQLLRAAFRLRGYEALITDAAGGRFILDEVHAYDTRRLGMILSLVEYLAKVLGGRFLVMSATLPGVLRLLLVDVLPGSSYIQADSDLYREYARHTIQVIDGGLGDASVLARVAAEARAGNSVLVVANTVSVATKTASALRELLDPEHVPVWLLHSRFTARDRFAKEQELLSKMATGLRPSEGTPLILVATQVVEVSLDVDFDTIYSEPAPLESLAQRFGRVNRKRRLPTADVHILSEPRDGQGIYERYYVEAALEVLRQASGTAIEEARLGTWLDRIYSEDIGVHWRAEVLRWKRRFGEASLENLKAFQSAPELGRAFDEMFDGTEVLPRSLVDEYRQLEEEDPLAASELLVPISYRQFSRLMRQGRIQKPRREIVVADVPYSPDGGLDLAAVK